VRSGQDIPKLSRARSQVHTPLHVPRAAESGIGRVLDGKVVVWIGFGVGVA